MQVQVSLTIEIAASATLSQMEQHLQEAGQQAMRQALKQTIRQWEDQRQACPHCGATQRRLEGTMRRVIATVFGRVQVPRRRFRCQQCQRRCCPATALFAELEGGTISTPLQEAAVMTACSWPYRVASSMLKKLSGAQISAEEMRLLTNQYGQQRADQQQVEAERVCAASTPAASPAGETQGVQESENEVCAASTPGDAAAEPVQPPTFGNVTDHEPTPAQAPAEPAEQPTLGNELSPADTQAPSEPTEQPMLVGVDGGWVCSREQRGGMEGKVAVVCGQMEDLPLSEPSATFSWSQRGARRPPKRRHRLSQRRYVATFGPAKQLGQLAAAAAQDVREGRARQVVMLADGAQWIKTEQARHFPQAVCILDWAHLWREVRHAIRVAARAKTLSARQRDYQLSLHRSWLWHGEVDQAVQGLRDLGTDLPAEALEAIQKAITYLQNQREWIGSYEHWRKQGYPVGSGMIERAVSLVINRRMKKRGMRWKRDNGTAVVALRTDLLNDDWLTPQRLRAFP